MKRFKVYYGHGHVYCNVTSMLIECCKKTANQIFEIPTNDFARADLFGGDIAIGKVKNLVFQNDENCSDRITIDVNEAVSVTFDKDIILLLDEAKWYRFVVRQSYFTKYENYELGPGLGDFIRGSFAVLEMCAHLPGTKFEICMCNHTAAPYFQKLCSCNAANTEKKSTLSFCGNMDWHTIFSSLQQIQSENIEKNNNIVIFASNSFTKNFQNIQNYRVDHLELRCHEVAKFFEPSLEMMRILKDRGLPKPKHYQVLHIRGGDPGTQIFFPKDPIWKVIDDAITFIRSQSILPVFVISDNIHLRKTVAKKYDLKEITGGNLNPGHFGNPHTTPEQIADTLTDFMCMRQSENIFQISCYSWGSGFSQAIEKLFGVPVKSFIF